MNQTIPETLRSKIRRSASGSNNEMPQKQAGRPEGRPARANRKNEITGFQQRNYLMTSQNIPATAM
jgi:hypothetical protein